MISGGVRIAARVKIITIACLKYFFKKLLSIKLIFAKITKIIGSSKIRANVKSSFIKSVI